jgi:hypothetical protein
MKAVIATNGASSPHATHPPTMSDDDIHVSDDLAVAMQSEYSIEADDDTTREVIWVAVDKCMRMHPAFSTKWHAVIDLLMDGEGPLPTGLRYYVATMVCVALRHPVFHPTPAGRFTSPQWLRAPVAHVTSIANRPPS